MNLALPLILGGALGSALLATGPLTLPGAAPAEVSRPAATPGGASAIVAAPAEPATPRVVAERRLPLGIVPPFGEVEVVAQVIVADGARAAAGGGPAAPAGDNGLGIAGFCCGFTDSCPPQPGAYVSGDRIAINYSWIETLPQQIGTSWPVDLTFALRGPNGSVVDLLDDPAYDLGDLSSVAGGTVGFCFSFLASVPSFPQGFGAVEQSMSVFSIQGGFPRTEVGGFTIN